MRYNKEVWAGVWKYTKLYLFVFLFTYFAADVWRLATGNLRPLRKKGILIEWLVNSKMEQCDSISVYNAKRTYTALRVTYIYNEPLINKKILSQE